MAGLDEENIKEEEESKCMIAHYGEQRLCCVYVSSIYDESPFFFC